MQSYAQIIENLEAHLKEILREVDRLSGMGRRAEAMDVNNSGIKIEKAIMLLEDLRDGRINDLYAQASKKRGW